jgi:ATP-dependent Lon protease
MEKTIAKKGQFEEMALLQQQPVELPLLPLKNMAILPKSILPIIVGRDFSISAVEAALKQDRMVFITAQKQESVEKPAFSDVFAQGTRAVILQVMRLQNGSLKILAEGISRSNITDFSDNGEFITVKCHDIYPETIVRSSEIDALWRELRE